MGIWESRIAHKHHQPVLKHGCYVLKITSPSPIMFDGIQTWSANVPAKNCFNSISKNCHCRNSIVGNSGAWHPCTILLNGWHHIEACAEVVNDQHMVAAKKMPCLRHLSLATLLLRTHARIQHSHTRFFILVTQVGQLCSTPLR